MSVSMRWKMAALASGAAMIPVLVMLALTFRIQRPVADRAREEVEQLARLNIAQIARDMTSLCATVNDLLQEAVNHDLAVAHELLLRAGGVHTDGEQVRWEAVNQATGEVQGVMADRLLIGTAPIRDNRDIHVATPFVDDVKRQTGAVCTILQRINAEGDLLRVATNVEGRDRRRAVGTYIPAMMPDGTQNPVVSAVLNGRTYRGVATVVGELYVAAYEPIRDAAGPVIGALFVGERIEDVRTLRQAVMNVQVGKTGYICVLGGHGDARGRYIISRRGERDGESILENSAIESIVTRAVRLMPNDVFFERYAWQNPGEPAPRQKLAAVAYFEPWDWVILATMYEDDYRATQQRIDDAISGMSLRMTLAGILVLLIVSAASMVLGRRVTRPLDLLGGLARKVAAGDLNSARKELANVSAARRDGATSGVAAKDEIAQLVDSFSTMTAGLESLIGQIRLSIVQVTTSSTEITASARQLESTIADQAASTHEVTASAKQISATAQQLRQTMENVASVASGTALAAGTGQAGVQEMEATMKELLQATDSISTRLSIISEKTSNIGTIVTTINKVADQINLLSLNAAVEAEKAGQHGLGFSVVAREIRRLADQTAVATLNIEKMVKEMHSAVSSGVMEMDKFVVQVRRGAGEVERVGGELATIIDEVQALTPRFHEVKEGMDAQTTGAEQISSAMLQLNAVASQNKAALSEFHRATEQLSEAIQALRKEVSHFTLQTPDRNGEERADGRSRTSERV